MINKKSDGFSQQTPFYFLLKILLSNNQTFLTLISAPLLLRTLDLIFLELGDPLSPEVAKNLMYSMYYFSLARGIPPLFYSWDDRQRGHLYFLKEVLHMPEVILTQQEIKPEEQIMRWFSPLVKKWSLGNEIVQAWQFLFLCCFFKVRLLDK